MTTKRIFTTGTAALALAAGMASAQNVANDTEIEAGTNIGAEISDTRQDIADTSRSIMDRTGDTLHSAGDATAEAASGIMSGASDAAAETEAVLSSDSTIKSNSGDVIGTVSNVDSSSGMIIVDLDTEMETRVSGDVQNVMVPMQNLSYDESGEVILDMTGEEFAAAVNMQVDGQPPPG